MLCADESADADMFNIFFLTDLWMMYRINDDLRAGGRLGSVSHPSVFVCCESGPLWPDSTADIHEPPSRHDRSTMTAL